MWNPNVAPVFSFEAYAKRHGLAKARERWAMIAERHKAEQKRADMHEQLLARAHEKRGPYVVNEDMGQVAWQMSPYSYVELHRSSLHERGAKGGELLADDDYMRYFLKMNPACRRKSVSGQIRSGWTPSVFDRALEAASHEGKLAKRVPILSAMERIAAAADEGKQQHGGLLS